MEALLVRTGALALPAERGSVTRSASAVVWVRIFPEPSGVAIRCGSQTRAPRQLPRSFASSTSEFEFNTPSLRRSSRHKEAESFRVLSAATVKRPSLLMSAATSLTGSAGQCRSSRPSNQRRLNLHRLARDGRRIAALGIGLHGRGAVGGQRIHVGAELEVGCQGFIPGDDLPRVDCGAAHDGPEVG